jgi:hypothetical protein
MRLQGGDEADGGLRCRTRGGGKKSCTTAGPCGSCSLGPLIVVHFALESRCCCLAAFDGRNRHHCHIVVAQPMLRLCADIELLFQRAQVNCTSLLFLGACQEGQGPALSWGMAPAVSPVATSQPRRVNTRFQRAGRRMRHEEAPPASCLCAGEA